MLLYTFSWCEGRKPCQDAQVVNNYTVSESSKCNIIFLMKPEQNNHFKSLASTVWGLGHIFVLNVFLSLSCRKLLPDIICLLSVDRWMQRTKTSDAGGGKSFLQSPSAFKGKPCVTAVFLIIEMMKVNLQEYLYECFKLKIQTFWFHFE